jgi:hypothetical protein
LEGRGDDRKKLPLFVEHDQMRENFDNIEDAEMQDRRSDDVGGRLKQGANEEEYRNREGYWWVKVIKLTMLIVCSIRNEFASQ